MKKKIISGIIFIFVGQIFALLIWLIFEENFFIPMVLGSIVGFLAGYREKKEENLQNYKHWFKI